MIHPTFSAALLAAAVATGQAPGATNDVPEGPRTISIQEMLVIGHSGMKLHSLAMITQGKVKGGVDESFLPGFKVCAEDPATPVRSVAARLVGEHFVAGREDPDPEAVGLLLKLARDESSDVRYSAVYHGLAPMKHKSDEVVGLLVDVAAANREPGLYDQIVQSLEGDRARVAALLDRRLAEGGDIALYEIYADLAGKAPARADRYLDLPSSRPRMFIFKGEGRDPEAWRAELERELKANGVESPDLFVSGVGDNFVLLLKTYITRDQQAVERSFANHDTFKVTQDFWMTPELEIQIDAMRKAQ